MFYLHDILHAIFDHFGQQSDASQSAINEDCVNRKTLASLCRVSKQFNAVGTPLLYRHVRMFNGDIQLFTRTILQNLQIRKLVKKLSLEFELPGTWDPDGVDEARRREVPSMDEEQWDYRRCLGEISSLLGMDPTFTGIGGADILVSASPSELSLKTHPEEDLAAVLLFILPELRYLRVKFDPMTEYMDPESAGYWRCDMFLQALRLPHFIKSQQHSGPIPSENQDLIPASLLHLEELVMCNPFEEPGTIKSSYPPIVFCSLHKMQPFWGLPNIKSLTLERASWDGSPPLIISSLEHLELLNTGIAPSKLPQLLKHFPSLRSIKYTLADVFDLTDINEMLLTREMLDSGRIEQIIRSCSSKLDEMTIVAVKRDDIDEDTLANLIDTEEDDSED